MPLKSSRRVPSAEPSPKVSAMASVEIGTTVFGDRVAECVERKRSQLVLGLDPVVDLLPVELQGDADSAEGRANAVARAVPRAQGGIWISDGGHAHCCWLKRRRC